MKITHRFHPLYGHDLVYIGDRCNRYGTRVLLQEADGTVSSVPRHWTDLVAPDPEVGIGGERSVFRVRDLLELVHLVDRLRGVQDLGESQ